MKLAVITLPDFFEGETEIVNELFRAGLERLHLRKPGAGRESLEEWIGRIKEEYRPRIILHDHFDLVLQYGLGGVHLNSRNPLAPQWLTRSGAGEADCAGGSGGSAGDADCGVDGKGVVGRAGEAGSTDDSTGSGRAGGRRFSLSRSCHSLEEISDNLAVCDYLFLSPIFDSISKQGYGAAFDRKELEQAAARQLLQDKVYALGGVCAENIGTLLQIGFHGAAVLGDLWQAAVPTSKSSSQNGNAPSLNGSTAEKDSAIRQCGTAEESSSTRMQDPRNIIEHFRVLQQICNEKSQSDLRTT